MASALRVAARQACGAGLRTARRPEAAFSRGPGSLGSCCSAPSPSLPSSAWPRPQPRGRALAREVASRCWAQAGGPRALHATAALLQQGRRRSKSWDEEEEAAAAMWEEAASGEQSRPSRRLQEEATDVAGKPGTRSEPPPAADLVLGICVRRHMAGFALVGFDQLLPLQFGLVDVRKAEEAQQKANEITAVLRELRQTGPEKLRQAMPEDETASTFMGDEGDEDEDEEGELRQFRQASVPRTAAKKAYRWIVCFDDSTVDRASPRNMAQTATQQATAMLQGLLMAECRRLFKTAAVLVHPRQSRQHLGIRGRGGEARSQVYNAARSRVHDFPAVTYDRSGTLKEDTYLISDAWAAARHAQRTTLVAGLREDPKLMSQLRGEIMGMRPMKRLREAAAELHPRQAGQELADVLESRVERQIDQQLLRLIEEEELRPAGSRRSRVLRTSAAPA